MTTLTAMRITYRVATRLKAAGKTGSIKSPGGGTPAIGIIVPPIPADCSGRLAVIYRVLNKLIFFEPAAMCNMPAEFVIAPLPAKRQLWEAKNAQDWNTQSQTEPQGQISYALAVDGEIIKLDQGRLSCRDAWLPYAPSDKEPASQIHNNRSRHCSNWWAEWCSGMDGMGGLIMLVASLA